MVPNKPNGPFKNKKKKQWDQMVPNEPNGPFENKKYREIP